MQMFVHKNSVLPDVYNPEVGRGVQQNKQTNTKIGWELKLDGCWIRKVCPVNPEGAKERWKGNVM